MIYQPLTVSAVVASEPHLGELASLMGSARPLRYVSVGQLLEAAGATPGVVVLGPDHTVCDAADFARRLREREGSWVVVLVRRLPEGEGWTGTPVTVGYTEPLERILASLGAESPAPLLELTSVLTHVARARHDINNPLTSALAETQLLLMDVAQGEVREGLERIQRQIRRIRDLVAALSGLRPPS